MSISTVTTACKTIQEGITGVEKAFAFDETPNALKGVKLPVFVNFPGAATYEGAGTSFATETRTYQMMLWIVPVNSPADAARHAETAETFLQRVRNAFLGRPQLGGLRYVQDTKLTGDSGPQVQSYAGVDYLEITFTLEVTEIAQVTYADGD